MSQERYTMVITYSESDGGYLADIPDLHYCTAFGNTPREALDELERAQAAWLKAAKQLQRQAPSPKLKCEPGEL